MEGGVAGLWRISEGLTPLGASCALNSADTMMIMIKN